MARPRGVEINEFALAEFREIRGFSKSELAVRAELSLSHYSEIERGLTRPSRQVIQRLSEALAIAPIAVERLAPRQERAVA